MYNLHYGRWQNSKYSLTLNKCVHKNPHRVSKAAFIGMVFNFSRIFRSVLVSKELNGVFVHNRHCMVQVDTLLFSCGPVWQDIYIAQYCIIDSVVCVQFIQKNPVWETATGGTKSHCQRRCYFIYVLASKSCVYISEMAQGAKM